MTIRFPRIGILGNPENTGTIETVQSLNNYLQDRCQHVIVEQSLSIELSGNTTAMSSREAIAQQCDLLIVVGGDGSMLQASHLATSPSPPILGINRGRLGFLTDIYPTELNSKLEQVLAGHYEEEQRFLLHAEITNTDNQLISADIALNDVVLNPGDVVSMLEFEIYIDDKFVCSQRGDGLIIATPTGSTAYALSAGGPILHPGLDAIVLVPMLSHTLTSRPIVIHADSQIDIMIAADKQQQPRISCDGKTFMPLPDHRHFRVSKYQHQLRLIHPQDYNYFETLRTKLHWGTKL